MRVQFFQRGIRVDIRKLIGLALASPLMFGCASTQTQSINKKEAWVYCGDSGETCEELALQYCGGHGFEVKRTVDQSRERDELVGCPTRFAPITGPLIFISHFFQTNKDEDEEGVHSTVETPNSKPEKYCKVKKHIVCRAETVDVPTPSATE